MSFERKSKRGLWKHELEHLCGRLRHIETYSETGGVQKDLTDKFWKGMLEVYKSAKSLDFFPFER